MIVLRQLICVATLIMLISPMAWGKVRGDRVTVTWAAPTEYTNGTNLPINEISYFSVIWECDTGKAGVIDHIDHLLTSMSFYSHSMLGQCVVTMTATATTGTTSDPSEGAVILIKLPIPPRGGFR